MSKNLKRFEAPKDRGGGRVRSGADNAQFETLTRFSFKFYNPSHAVFHCRDREIPYFLTLLERLKSLCMVRMSELTARSNDTTRFHRIDWNHKSVSQDGFGIRGSDGTCDDYDEEAWQFSLSSNEHGRVHGFVIDNVFYIVWLDPEHKLYASRP
jgi:hypothetical protein